MFREEKSFTLKFNLEAQFPEDYDGDDDDYGWLHDWETRVKPEVLKVVTASLRAYPTWTMHIRNRGMDATDEIEIALERKISDQAQLP